MHVGLRQARFGGPSRTESEGRSLTSGEVAPVFAFVVLLFLPMQHEGHGMTPDGRGGPAPLSAWHSTHDDDLRPRLITGATGVAETHRAQRVGPAALRDSPAAIRVTCLQLSLRHEEAMLP